MKLVCPRCGGLIGYVSSSSEQPGLEDDLIEAHECPEE
jgi:hypothetical protein